MKKLLFLLILFTVFIGFMNVTAAPREAYNIVTNPSENMSTSMNVNWHSDVADSFLEYTLATDTTYSQKQQVMGTCRAFSLPTTIGTFTTSGFLERNVCSATIENLEPNTKYMYRVGKTTFSQNNYFTTSSSGPFTFLYITDPQYGSETQANIFNSLMTQAFSINPDIAFTFFTGDVIDRGGIESQWNLFFTRSNVPRGIIATGVGNHEYYDASSSPLVYNNTFYNAYNNNPKNGATTLLNSTYHFVYNNTLFIMIDTEGGQLAAQKEWFARAVEENIDVDFIVVGMHRSFYGSVYANDSVTVRSNWQSTFDKYGVDLVLSGHDHIYARSHSVYKNQISTDPIRGTTYVIGGYGGAKFYSVTPNAMYAHTVEQVSVASLISVDENSLSLRLINTAGTTLDSHTINKKRLGTIDEAFSKAAFLDGLVVTPDSVYKTMATLTWPNNGFKNVGSIKVINTKYNYSMAEAFVYHESFTSLPFSGLALNTLNEFKVSVSFLDKTTEDVLFTVDNRPPAPIVYISFSEAMEQIFTTFNAAVSSFIGG